MPKSARSLWTAKLSGKPVHGSKAGATLNPGPPLFRGIVLGIDPSLRGTGLALIDCSLGPEKSKLLGSRTLKLKATATQAECLGEIHRAVCALIERHRPHCIAIEQTIYVQNFQTAQILGMARGAAIGPAAAAEIPVHEYAPLRIKQAVVGYGRASKEQVAALVKQLLRIATELPLDESDAAAVALCHALTWKPAQES